MCLSFLFYGKIVMVMPQFYYKVVDNILTFEAILVYKQINHIIWNWLHVCQVEVSLAFILSAIITSTLHSDVVSS